MSRKNTRLKLKKMTTLTVFLAVSLCISLAESFFPPLVPIPKGKLGNGYRREKAAFIPKGKSGNGYRKKKWIEIPKRKGKWTGNLLPENEIGKI